MCKNHQTAALYAPTLRLSITDTCFGQCPFCHREGQDGNCSNGQMSLETVVNEVVPAIERIGISKVILTGGEPTLHPQLVDIARVIRNTCPHTHIGITTNGYDTEKLHAIAQYVDKLTISISSYNPAIYRQYTGIAPLELLNAVNKMNVRKKAVSIVITEDNYDEMDYLLSDILQQGYEVKLQFVIGPHSLEDQRKHAVITRLCDRFGMYQIETTSTPTLIWNTEGSVHVRLKLSSLNQFVYDNLAPRRGCLECQNKKYCIERGCAIRIHPNGEVSPCLNGYITFKDKDIKQCIESAYAAMELI